MTDDQFQRNREDPVAFIEETLGVRLYSRQREIAEAVRDHDRVATKSGNATGKTLVAVCVSLAWLAAGPGNCVAVTSATEGQLKRVYLREMRRRLKHGRAREFFGGATITDSEVRLRDDWFLTAFSTDEAEAAQGLHAERLLVVLDEASGISEIVWDAVEGLLAGGDAHVLAISNPLRTSGSFYDAFHSKRDEWHTITVSAFDTPNFTGERVPRALSRNLVSRRWVERLERRNPEGSEYVVKCLGQFPTRADDAVVARADLEQAHEQIIEAALPLVIGVDVARFGGDKTVLAVREGHRVRVAKVYAGKDLMWTTGAVLDLARELHAAKGRKPRIVVDDVGLGGGVTDRLREIGEFQITAFNGSGRASSRDAVNRRSELWLLAGEVMPLLDLDGGDDELSQDLLAPTFSFASDGARMVEQKSSTRKRLRRSPDRADAVLLTLAVSPPVAPGRARKRRGLHWAKDSLDDFKIGGGSTAPGFAAGAPSIPVPGASSLDDRLRQLGMAVVDPVADALRAGALGRVAERWGAPHPDLVQGGETPRGSTVTKAPNIAPLMTGPASDGTVWNGPEGKR